MQRDVKVGLVLGVLLVAVVAVVFFRREDEDRDRFTQLLPAPDAMADRARDMLGNSPSDPYPVGTEFLADSWQSGAATKAARTPTPARNRSNDRAALIEPLDPSNPPSDDTLGRPPAVLHPPEFDPPRPAARSRSDAPSGRSRVFTPSSLPAQGNAFEYTIRDGDTLSRIASEWLGSAAMASKIYEANLDVLSDPDNIPAGQKIRIPGMGKNDRSNSDRLAAQSTTSSATPPRRTRTPSLADSSRNHADTLRPGSNAENTHIVREGDTLIRIARDRYGRDAMYVEILRANPQISSPADLQPGMVLRLP